MCRAFSCLVTNDPIRVHWKMGTDSHDALWSQHRDDPQLADGPNPQWMSIEVTPDNGDYLNPDHWTLHGDRNDKPHDWLPAWWTCAHADAAMAAQREWYAQICKIVNMDEARNPVHPFAIEPPAIGEEQIALLRQWASVWAGAEVSVWVGARASAGASVWGSVEVSAGVGAGIGVGASVWASVELNVRFGVWPSTRPSMRANMRAYTGSLYNIWPGGYLYQPAVDLWRQGLVPSFDGEIWRLHGGPEGKVLWEGAI